MHPFIVDLTASSVLVLHCTEAWLLVNLSCVTSQSPSHCNVLSSADSAAQIFLNALRQQTARVSRVPVDDLKLVS